MNRMMVIALCLVSMMIGIMMGCIVENMDNNEYAECGTCGAHVDNWWYVHDNNNNLVEVCSYCYEEELNN